VLANGKGSDKRQIDSLTSVTHGDSHGRNMTWSDEFRQFQMIDFEHVRFGYIFSDQIKLVVSTLTQVLAGHLGKRKSHNRTSERKLAREFEEALIALTSFSAALQFSREELKGK